MKDRIDDITKAKQSRRQKKGWTLGEIKEQATKDFNKNKKISEKTLSPDNFYSGDMEKFLKSEDDNEE